MENKFNNLINEMKKGGMTAEEKAAIRFKITTFAGNNPVQVAQPSPYFSKFSFASFGKMSLAGLLLVVLGVGGLSSASADALPGDKLYPIKIHIKEKIEESLVFSSEKKVALKQERIETRFKEIETLVKEDRATEEDVIMIAASIEIEKDELSKELDKLNEGHPEVAVLAIMDIENSIKNRQNKVDNAVEENELNALSKELENSLSDDIDSILEQVNELGKLNIILEEENKKEITTNEEVKKEEIKEDKLIIENLETIPTTQILSPISSQEINSTTSNRQQ